MAKSDSNLIQSTSPAGAPTLDRAITRRIVRKTRHSSAARRNHEAALLRQHMLEASAAAGSPVAAKLLSGGAR